jgi:hypothetical protein
MDLSLPENYTYRALDVGDYALGNCITSPLRNLGVTPTLWRVFRALLSESKVTLNCSRS